MLPLKSRSTLSSQWAAAALLFSGILAIAQGLQLSGGNRKTSSSSRTGVGLIGKLGSSKSDLIPLHIGLIVPHSFYQERNYIKAVGNSINEISPDRSPTGRRKKGQFTFFEKYSLGVKQILRIMMTVNPSPTKILDNLCDEFLRHNVTTILYLTNSELFGRSTASSQYFLQLASYLGIPVIAWNADNSGLERRSQTRLQLQLAPSLEHQVAAMLSILVRYNWQQFSVVTSEIAGHDDFVQAVRDRVAHMKTAQKFSFRIQVEAKVTSREDLRNLELSETRILLLYSTKPEARQIMEWAKEAGLTGDSYVWVTTQSVIGESKEASSDFPAGMLGVSFDTSLQDLIDQIPVAMQVFARGVEAFVQDSANKKRPMKLIPKLSCDSELEPVTSTSGGRGFSKSRRRGNFLYEGADNNDDDDFEDDRKLETRWSFGEAFHKYLRNVTIKKMNRPDVSFSSDGTLKNVELKIMNLRPGLSSNLVWEEIGVWKSYEEDNAGLDIKDIVWPGHSHVPPQGVPEKFHLTVGFLEEPPFINLAMPDPVTGRCNVDRGVKCKVQVQDLVTGTASASSAANSTASKQYQCCSGFCIDLLAKFADDLQFEFDLIRVEDPKWGVLRNGKWNGLMAELVEKKFDMVLTSLKVNSEREAAVDFTSPFLESGTTILVARRTGIISPTAFLEPFDAASWTLVLLVVVNIAAFTIFFYEWLSPAGYDMRSYPGPDHKFSLFRTYWMVWALLFQAPVNMDVPRAFTARFMASVWALFAVVFLAIYTANLAAFMITREEWYDFKGLDDPRLSNPTSMKPPLKFGTVPWTYTESAIKKNNPTMFEYMKNFNRSNVLEGINAVKRGELGAFVYDATVLEYLVAQDEECRLLTVGTWYAMTGYGAAFPRNSKHFANINRKIMEYSENGDLERLRRFWLTGTCNPKKEEKKASEPLAPEQFLSVFLLLVCGIAFAALLTGLEHVYMKWIRGTMQKHDQASCFALVSLSVGKSLTFRGTVQEAQELMRTHKCKDPICDTHLWKVRHELDMAKMKMKRLESELLGKGLPLPAEDLFQSNTPKLKQLHRHLSAASSTPNDKKDDTYHQQIRAKISMNSTPSVGEKLRSPFSSMSMQGSSVPPDTTIGHLQYSPTTDARRVPSFEVINSAPSPPNPGGFNLSARQSAGEVPPAKQSCHSPNVYGTKSPPSLHLSSAVDQQLQLERSSRSSGVSKTPEIANSPPFKEDEGGQSIIDFCEGELEDDDEGVENELLGLEDEEEDEDDTENQMTTTSLLRHHSQSSCCSLLPPPTDVVPPPLLADKLADINKCKGVEGGGRISAGRLAAASVAVQGNIQQNQPNPSSACQHPFSGSSSPQSLTPSPPLELIAAPGRANDQSCSSTKQSQPVSNVSDVLGKVSGRVRRIHNPHSDLGLLMAKDAEVSASPHNAINFKLHGVSGGQGGQRRQDLCNVVSSTVDLPRPSGPSVAPSHQIVCTPNSRRNKRDLQWHSRKHYQQHGNKSKRDMLSSSREAEPNVSAVKSCHEVAEMETVL